MLSFIVLRSRVLLLLVLLTLVSATTACSEREPEVVQLKVITLPFITFAPYYIALEEGYFTEQNLEIELVDMRRQEEILPALASGQVDVSSGLLSAGVLNTIARGGEISMTADKGFVDPDGCTNYALIGRADLIAAGVFDDPAGLAGRTINVVPATWLEFYLAELLASGSLTLNDIEKTNVTAPAIPEAFAAAEVDGNVNSEPWVTILARSGHVPVLDLPQDLRPDDMVAMQLYGPNLLGDNTDVGTRFMVAYLKGVRQYQEGKTERNLEIVAAFTELEPALLEAMCWPAVRSSGEVNVDTVMAFQEWAVGAGYMDEVVQPDAFYDARFIEEATEILDEGG